MLARIHEIEFADKQLLAKEPSKEVAEAVVMAERSIQIMDGYFADSLPWRN